MWKLFSQQSLLSKKYMKTIELLQEMWFSRQQSEVFVMVYQYWPKPASSLAKMMGIERTNMYKMLKVLVNKWLIWQTTKQWAQQFFVAEWDVLLWLINERKREVEQWEDSLQIAQSELKQMQEQRIWSLPQMRFFEGKDGMQRFFEDIQTYILEHDYLIVKFFASNTLESQSQSPYQLSEYSSTFFESLEKEWVRTEAYLGNGIMMLEHVLKTYDIWELESLPAWSSAVQVFVVGEAVWIAFFNQIPFGIKIINRAFADVIHFFFKQMG